MQELERIAEFLVKVPLFQNLKKRQIERLAKRVVAREYRAGHP